MKNFIYAAIAVSGFTIAQAQTPTLYSGDGVLASTRTVTMAGKNLTFKPNTGSFFVNGANGFTGINTVSPTVHLDVNGNMRGATGFFTRFAPNGQTFATNNDRIKASLSFTAGAIVNPDIQLGTLNFLDMGTSNMDPSPVVWFSIDNRNHYTRFRFRGVENGASQFLLYDKVQVVNFQVVDDGNNNIFLNMPKANSYVGIGTTSYTDGTDTYKLSVAGNVRANRVKVYTTWADYVFEKGYKLPTLEEVEQHIKEKGHLQDIPSAAEVEAKGIELGEMNKLLLQKIEELTLYTIELNKQVQELKANANKQ